MFFWCIFFFFKKNTAYEMRICDWGSEVCSSDLRPAAVGETARVCRYSNCCLRACSINWTCREIDDGARPSRRATSEKLPWSSTAQNNRRALKPSSLRPCMTCSAVRVTQKCCRDAPIYRTTAPADNAGDGKHTRVLIMQASSLNAAALAARSKRSDARRVGKECVSTCRYWGE